LIRDFDDFGVMLLGDPRLHSKGYGRIFLAALPPAPVVRDSGTAAAFLRERLRAVRAEAPAASGGA